MYGASHRVWTEAHETQPSAILIVFLVNCVPKIDRMEESHHCHVRRKGKDQEAQLWLKLLFIWCHVTTVRKLTSVNFHDGKRDSGELGGGGSWYGVTEPFFPCI